MDFKPSGSSCLIRPVLQGDMSLELVHLAKCPVLQPSEANYITPQVSNSNFRRFFLLFSKISILYSLNIKSTQSSLTSIYQFRTHIHIQVHYSSAACFPACFLGFDHFKYRTSPFLRPMSML